MFAKIQKAVVALAVAGAAAVPCSAFAALDSATATSIQSGITGSDATFYLIGGTVLVVLAGIWGFRKIVNLLMGR